MYPLYDYDITAGSRSQLDELVGKLKPKKEWALASASWLAKHVSATQLGYFTHCGDYLTMLADETLSKRKIETAFFCKMRLCPGCAWRSALRSAACVAAISEKLVTEGRIMLFVTLTIPNVKADRLRQSCLDLNVAWAKLMRRKAYAVWADNIRKMEITYNAHRDDFHPHIHAVVYVKPNYFGGSGGYISQAQLLQDWRHATGINEITQVDVRRCRSRESGSNAILEVSKYSAKASDYTTSERVFDVMYDTLYHLRSMTYSGYAKAYKADYDTGRLDAYLPSDDTKYVYRLVYRYYAEQGYVQTKQSALVPENTDADADAKIINRVLQHKNVNAVLSARRAENSLLPNWEELISD